MGTAHFQWFFLFFVFFVCVLLFFVLMIFLPYRSQTPSWDDIWRIWHMAQVVGDLHDSLPHTIERGSPQNMINDCTTINQIGFTIDY